MTNVGFEVGAGDRVVGTATSYGLDDREVGVRVPVGSRSFLHVVQTGSGVHTTSYQIGAGALPPGVKRPGREAEQSPPTSAEVMKMWIYTSTPHTPSWRSVLSAEHRDFTLGLRFSTELYYILRYNAV
jgi:hypothetical protein